MESNNPISAFLKLPNSFYAALSLRKIVFNKAIISLSFSWLSFIRKLGITCVVLFSISTHSWGQTTGDYRSNASGNWSALATWQRYNGAAWVAPTAAQGYPGQNASPSVVTILNANVVALDVSPANSLGALAIAPVTNNISTLQFNNGTQLTVAGIVTLGNAGNNNRRGTLTMTNGGTLICNGFAVANGGANTFTPGTGTIQLNATNTLPATIFTSFNNLIIAIGTTTLGTNITINGNLSINGTAVLACDVNQITGNASGTFTMASGTGLTLGSASTATIVLFPTNFIASKITLNAASTVTYQANINQAVSNVPAYGNLTIATNGTTKTCDGNLTINGNLAVNGTSIFSANITSGTWNIAGTASIAGTLDFGTVTVKNITINGNLSGAGSITMNGGAIAHVLTLNGASNAISAFAAGSGKVIYNGTVAQQVFAGSYYNLTINNSSGVTLSGSLTASNTLTMTSGNITTGTYTLGLSNSAIAGLIYTSGTIIGTFNRAVSVTGSDYLYPVGTASNYNAAKINFTTVTAGYLSVTFNPSDIGNTGLPLVDNTVTVVDRNTAGYWTMVATAPMASGNYNVTLYYNGFSGVDNYSRIIKRTNGGSLTLDGTHGTVSSPIITRTGLTGGISTTTTDFGIGKGSTVVITAQPSSYSGCNASFAIAATTTNPPLTYQWQENSGSGFSNITDGGIYSGSSTSILTITGATSTMNGYTYRCIVNDANLNSVTSNIATLTVSIPAVTLGYNYYSDITVSAASGSSSLTDFPLLISFTDNRLKTVANGGHVQNTNGYDIIFTDAGNNPLYFQIESYTATTGNYVAWVRVPVLSNSSTTTVRMYYGNSSVTVNPSSTSTWVSDYKGVWHLNSTDYTDGTSNANNGTATAVTSINGIIAGAQSFNGTTSFISVSTNGFVPNNNNQTISVWGYYAATPAAVENLISFQNTGAGSAIQLGFRTGPLNVGAWKWGGVWLASTATIPSAGAWHYYTYTYDGTTSVFYVDGSQVASSIVAPQTALPSEGNIGRYNNGEYWNGYLDEPRFSISPKTAGWIQTEYNNQKSPSTFNTLGAESTAAVMATVGACSTTYALNQGSPSGGTYSGTGVTGNNFNASVAGVGTHAITYTYTDVTGCSASASQNIVVTAVPSAPAASSVDCCTSNILDLSATGTNLKWYSDAGLTNLVGTGTPFATGKTAAGTYTYYVTQTINGCESAATSVSLNVYSALTITTQPTAQTICSTDNAIFSVVASGANLTYQWQENSGSGFSNITNGGVYSGALTNTLTLTVPGISRNGYTYRCVVSSTCGASPLNSNGVALTISSNNTITLTSVPATTSQTVCINTAITNITYATTGATGANFSGLPTGVTGAWAGNVVTISGAPSTTVGSPFSYTVTLTGGCGTVTASGTITVTAANTITLTSAAGTDNQTVCINTAITNITYSTTGATGAAFSGLPAGVTGAWAGNVVTISGTPSTTAGSPFSYTVTLIGGCGTVTATGIITVAANNTISLTSAAGTDNQTICINTAITNITYSTTGATGATFTGLPTGVTGSWLSNVVTISGTPTASGTFPYTVTLTGGCGTTTASGTITVTANNTITLTSAVGTDNQTVCINTAITSITYSTSGATGAAFAGLPTGVTGAWAGNVVTISGTPGTTIGSPF
ncbi:MAG: DUF2341 domain-containing protein, partial [Bacteroidales bacterium]